MVSQPKEKSLSFNPCLLDPEVRIFIIVAIDSDLFQLRDLCCNKQLSRLLQICSSSSSLRPGYRHIHTSSSSVRLLLLVSTK
ncbi:hypothetical protein ACB092_08G187900 [Castanea dentata]